MNALHIYNDSVSKARLTMSLEMAPPHLKPIVQAVRDGGCGWLTVAQDSGRFDLPKTKIPIITVLGDDLYSAKGPSAFHAKSVRRLVGTCDFAAIIACEALPQSYAEAAGRAVVSRRNVVIVETQPEHEISWIKLIQEINPRIAIRLSTVQTGRA